MIKHIPTFSETGELIIPLPEKTLASAIIQDVHAITEALKALPQNPSLGKSIEKARQRIDGWTTKMSADSVVALQRHANRAPSEFTAIEKTIAARLGQYHHEVREAIDILICRSNEVRSSVDVEACRNDLAKHFGLMLEDQKNQMPGETVIPVEGNLIHFDDVVITQPQTVREEPELKQFFANLTPADIQRLTLDILSWDDSKKRAALVSVFVDEALARSPGVGVKNKEKLVQGIAEFIDQLRKNERPNPYNQKVSNHVLFGVLPEAPAIYKETYANDFDSWRNNRQQKESGLENCGPEALSASMGEKADTEIPQYSKNNNHTKILDGAFVIYNGQGKVEERVVTGTEAEVETIKEYLGDSFAKENSAEHPVGIYFVDKHELEDAILYLQANKGAILYLQMKGEDIQCSIYRDKVGNLRIDDHLGNPIAPLRNSKVTAEDILRRPFDFFSVRNMRLEVA